MQRTVLLSQFCLYVCLSVCLSDAWSIVTKRNNRLSISQHVWNMDICSISTPTGLLGIVPFHPKYSPKVTHSFEKRQLRPISAHNVSTVSDSEKSSIMTNRKSTTSFPTSYRWSAYVASKCPKGWLKKQLFFRFLNKSQLQSNKVCYKVSLCENFQKQSCRATNQLWNNRKRTESVFFRLKYWLKLTYPVVASTCDVC